MLVFQPPLEIPKVNPVEVFDPLVQISTPCNWLSMPLHSSMHTSALSIALMFAYD